MLTPLLQPEGESPVQVVVAGAGIAGLSAALHLTERGVQTLVLEADPQFCGGRVAAGETVEVGEWRFCQDHGVHAVWSPYRNLLATLTRHQIRPMLVPAQEESWVYRRRGRIRRAAVGSAIRYSWLPAPFHYLNLFLRPDFLCALTLQDWLSLPLVWYGLAMAIGIDPLREDQPMEGWVLEDMMRGWSPSISTNVFTSTSMTSPALLIALKSYCGEISWPSWRALARSAINERDSGILVRAIGRRG
ncbi:MAG: FAD-dependent oxidoreductase, partial [Anaerolineae bacterium]